MEAGGERATPPTGGPHSIPVESEWAPALGDTQLPAVEREEREEREEEGGGGRGGG